MADTMIDEEMFEGRSYLLGGLRTVASRFEIKSDHAIAIDVD